MPRFPTAAGMPVTIIRGGTSRGLYLRGSDLPDTGPERGRALVRLFGGEEGSLSDGLGGEHPVLRKVAVVDPAAAGEDGIPRLRYQFGQVNADLSAVAHNVECGNIAAGVPLFGALNGWSATEQTGVWLELQNSGKAVLAEWLAFGQTEGRVRLSFVAPCAEDPALALPTGAAREHYERTGHAPLQYSVVRALNDYVFVDGASLGIEDPAGVSELKTGTWDLLHALMLDLIASGAVQDPLKMCLIGRRESGRLSLSCLVVYPAERRLHDSFAVTGAVTLAVATCIPDTVSNVCVDLKDGTSLDIHHPSGTLPISWVSDGRMLPARVGVERTCRLILSGYAH